MDHKLENVSDETISKSESSEKKIDLFIKQKERKSKKDRKGQKSTWKESTNYDLVDCICSNEHAKNKLFLLTIKHQRMQKLIGK